MTAVVSRIRVRFAIGEWRRAGGPLYGPGHAVLLGILRHASPSMSEALHDANVRKPFALSPLTVQGRGNGLAEADLTINVWDIDLADRLSEALVGALDINTRVNRAPAVVTDVVVDPPVVLDNLLPDRAPPCVRVRFDSPTFFSLGRRFGHQQYGLLPVPELVVRSWRRAWQSAGGPVADVLDVPTMEDRVALWDVHSLQTQVVRGEKTALTGFTGSATYAWIGEEASDSPLLVALARFAEYCGTGAKTGHGFGRTRFTPARDDGRGEA